MLATLVAAAVTLASAADIAESFEVYEVTAYTAGVESTGKTPDHPAYGVTASGATVEQGVTCACPPDVPFGAEVYVPALDATYTCQDRGSAITEGHIDIYMEQLADALDFGRQRLLVRITEGER